MRAIFKRYLVYIKDYKVQYFIVLFGIILTVLATIATAEIMKYIMDDMLIEKNEAMLYLVPMSLIVIYIVKAIGRYLQTVYMGYIGQHIVTRFREVLLEKIINLDMTFLYLNRNGELISRVTNDINRIQYFVANMFPELIRESLTVVGLVAYVTYLNPILAAYSLIGIPLIMYPLVLVAKN